jgi:exopolyphosphatase/pppGpp-phosphohydrolase
MAEEARRHQVRAFGTVGTAGLRLARNRDDALAAIAADLSRIDGRQPPDTLVAMGGAMPNITAVKLELASYDPDRVQGAVLDRADLDRQIELTAHATPRRAGRSSGSSPSAPTSSSPACASSGWSWRSWASRPSR